jgi:antitoxin (DNA-binding transcriptional repressor) of toxin-antitoxin stability system
MTAMSAYGAKTHLPRLLRAVEQGERIVITRRGKPVAEQRPDWAEIIDRSRPQKRDGGGAGARAYPGMQAIEADANS